MKMDRCVSRNAGKELPQRATW